MFLLSCGTCPGATDAGVREILGALKLLSRVSADGAGLSQTRRGGGMGAAEAQPRVSRVQTICLESLDLVATCAK